MDKKQKMYYQKMRLKNRLIPIIIDGKVCGLFTFYISNGNLDKYTERDPWDVIEDEPTGNICYIAQFLTNKKSGNQRYSRQVLNDFINHIKDNFSNVESVCWRRFKNNRTHTYIKEV